MKNNFPLKVLHPKLQTIIKNIAEQSQVNTNTIAANMLVAVGYSIEHKYQIQVDNSGWFERSNLFLINVSESGTGKSHILDRITKSITNKQKTLRDQYSKDLKNYMSYKDCLKSGELKGVNEPETHLKWCLNNLGNGIIPTEPRKLYTYAQDSTPEGFKKALSTKYNDGRPILIQYDEIKGYFDSFDSRRKGGDNEDFLTYFNYYLKDKLRYDDDLSLFINETNVCLIGATQMDAMYDILSYARKENGFTYRMLLCVDDDTVDIKDRTKGIFYKINHSPDIDPYSDFNYMIDRFLDDFDSDVLRTNLKLSTECKQYFDDWDYELKNRKVDIDLSTWLKIVAKMHSYFFRIAIIINRLNAYYTDNLDNIDMKLEDFHASAEIINYFINNTVAILEKTDNNKNRFFKSNEEQEHFEGLPDTITYSDLLKGYMSVLKQSEKTAKRAVAKWVENKLIAKNRENKYYKL